jgi:hypothetical protein
VQQPGSTTAPPSGPERLERLNSSQPSLDGVAAVVPALSGPLVLGRDGDEVLEHVRGAIAFYVGHRPLSVRLAVSRHDRANCSQSCRLRAAGRAMCTSVSLSAVVLDSRRPSMLRYTVWGTWPWARRDRRPDLLHAKHRWRVGGQDIHGALVPAFPARENPRGSSCSSTQPSGAGSEPSTSGNARARLGGHDRALPGRAAQRQLGALRGRVSGRPPRS